MKKKTTTQKNVIPCDKKAGIVNKTNPTFKNLSRMHHICLFYNSTNSWGAPMMKMYEGHCANVNEDTITITQKHNAKAVDVKWDDVEYYVVKLDLSNRK